MIFVSIKKTTLQPFKYFLKINHPNLKLEDHSNFLSQSLDNNRNHPNTKASYKGEALVELYVTQHNWHMARDQNDSYLKRVENN